MSDSPDFDPAIRPTSWEEYRGQKRMKGRLEIGIDAAIQQDRKLDHILLIAPPGTGKTTLAALIAERFLADFTRITMPIKMDRFFEIVETAEGVVFIDELHAAGKAFQEMLQPGLEDGVITMPDGWEINVEGLVFIGATITEFAPRILDPLKDRFEVKPTWEPYSPTDIALIMTDMAKRIGFEVDPEVAAGLAGACGATPRLAKPFVKAARDLQAVGRAVTVRAVLDHVGVDADGLGSDHLKYLDTLRNQKGRLGLRPLANLMSMSPASVEDLERVLSNLGLVHLSSTGRRITPAGRTKLTESKDLISA